MIMIDITLLALMVLVLVLLSKREISRLFKPKKNNTFRRRR